MIEPQDDVDRILLAILVTAVLRAMRQIPATASAGLAGAAAELAATMPGVVPIPLRTTLERIDQQCRMCLDRGESLDVTTLAHLCAMGAISPDDPRHQALFELLLRTNDAPDRMARLLQHL